MRRRRRGVLPVAAVALLLAASPAPAQGTRDTRDEQDRRRGGDARRAVRELGRTLERAAEARQQRRATARFDPIFRKYTRRYFGLGVDWRLFKAQGMAESDLIPTARSRVGARGVMQLMPSTFNYIRSRRPEFRSIDDPEWNIAAGIMHNRHLYTLFERQVPAEERWDFMFASYNAGEGTIARARQTAAAARLDARRWSSIERVAPQVGRWRYNETLEYVRKIRANHRALPPR